MGRARRLAGSRRVRIAVNAVFVTGALAAAVLTMLHFLDSGWPLASADPLLVVAAGILFLFAYAFKAWGWQRLFREEERPQALTLAAAGGASTPPAGARRPRLGFSSRFRGRCAASPCSCS